MANFEESRFLGLSSRTIWLSIAVVGIVVALFFVPELIRDRIAPKQRVAAVSTAKKDEAKKAGAKAADAKDEKAQSQSDGARAALAPDVLKELNSPSDAPRGGAKVSAPNKSAQSAERGSGKKLGTVEAPQDEGFFSGLNLKVKAGGLPAAGSIGIPSGLTIDKLNSKQAQSFFKSGHAEVLRFYKQSKYIPFSARDVMEGLLNGLDSVARGLPRDVNAAEVAVQLQQLHAAALQTLRALRSDRGLLLEYLRIPVVRFIDESGGGSTTARLVPFFAPRMELRNAVLKRVWSGPGVPPGATLDAEIGVRGSDVERVVVYAGNEKMGEYPLSFPDAQGFSTVRVRGDGMRQWTVVAIDKYGARPFVKHYSFLPRARRFGVDRDGRYRIAFRPGSARNSLDRYFYAGGTSLEQMKRDPAIGVF